MQAAKAEFDKLLAAKEADLEDKKRMVTKQVRWHGRPPPLPPWEEGLELSLLLAVPSG